MPIDISIDFAFSTYTYVHIVKRVCVSTRGTYPQKGIREFWETLYTGTVCSCKAVLQCFKTQGNYTKGELYLKCGKIRRINDNN